MRGAWLAGRDAREGPWRGGKTGESGGREGEGNVGGRAEGYKGIVEVHFTSNRILSREVGRK